MISGFFGLPGSGKTTYLSMLAQKQLRLIKRNKSRYKRVFSNFYCKGCLPFSFDELGTYDFSDSLILIDEITMFADNRDFKRFPPATRDFFILHRHYNCDVIYFTQYYNNVDKKIRDLTYDLFFLKPLGPFSIARRIWRTLDIDKYTHDIVFGYRFANFWDFLSGRAFHFCFRPRWYKYFDTFELSSTPPPLPDRDTF